MEGVLLLSPGLMEYSSRLLFLYILHLYLTSYGFTFARYSYSMNLCVCVCVCLIACVCQRERQIDLLLQRDGVQCMILVARVGASSRFRACLVGTCGQLPRPLLTSLAHPKPLHRPRALPARNDHRGSKESVPHSCPGSADATSHWRKSDGCFVRPTYCWVYVI